MELQEVPQTEQAPEQTVSPELAASLAVDETVRIAEIKFEEAMKSANMLMGRMSKRNVQRAVMFSTNILNGDTFILPESKTKLVHKDEAILAALFAQMMDLRTIIQANLMKKEMDEESTNQGEENVEQ